MNKSSSPNQSILTIAGFGIWVDGTPRTSKIETHIQPIADASGHVDFVCTGPTSDNTEGIMYHQIQPSRWKLITLFKQLLLALRLAIFRDYDLIVSFSLVPYGVFALLAKYVSRTPAHLGIIGSDLDVHAQRRYAPIVTWLFRRFDVVTVAGEEFQRRVADCGVPREKIFTVLHPIGAEYTREAPAEGAEYDILWLTRVSEVKNPLLFVDILSELRDRSVEFSAALVGSGSMDEQVMDAVEDKALEDNVDVPGWTDSPEEYYRNAKVYVMTSRREMLPLTLVEAMLAGTPPVAPALGGIPDIIDDGENGIVVDSRDVDGYTDSVERLLSDEQFRRKLASNAPKVESQVSYEAVADSWRDIFNLINKTLDE